MEPRPHYVPCVPIPRLKDHGSVMRFGIKQHWGALNHCPCLQRAQFGVVPLPAPTDHYDAVFGDWAGQHRPGCAV